MNPVQREKTGVWVKLPLGMLGALNDLITFLSADRYCQQVLNETVRTAKLTPVAARLQEVEGKVDQHVIPKEVSAFLLFSPLTVTVSLVSGRAVVSGG